MSSSAGKRRTASKLNFTKISDVGKAVAKARAAFNSGKTRSVDWRKQQIRQMVKMVNEERGKIEAALAADLRKHPLESYFTEIGMIKNDALEILENLDEWIKPDVPSVGLIDSLSKPRIYHDPRGVVLIMGAFNYPFQLTLIPLLGAIAGGNAVVVKPSEASPHSAQVMTDLIAKYLDKSAICVVNGAVPETTELLTHRFDLIFYTGGTVVGKIVYQAAAKHLTPVVLELGGKNPCFVDDNCDLAVCAQRIIWGRMLNNGQTCLSPDYILCSKKTQTALIPHLQNALEKFYGKDIKKSEQVSRMVNTRHWERVCNMIKSSGGKIVIGGEFDKDDLYISPTVVIDCDEDSDLANEEVFGPVLVIRTIKDLDEGLKIVNENEKPLALYAFSNDKTYTSRILSETSSGGAVINDCLMHAACSALPFGGVGNSGIGAYHGIHSFKVFTHEKAVMLKDQKMEFVNNVRYPPLSQTKTDLLNFLIGRSEPTCTSKLVSIASKLVLTSAALGLGLYLGGL